MWGKYQKVFVSSQGIFLITVASWEGQIWYRSVKGIRCNMQ